MKSLFLVLLFSILFNAMGGTVMSHKTNGEKKSINNNKSNSFKNYPVAFSHVGITVPNLEKAVDFYTNVLGLYLIMPPTEIFEDDSAIGQMCKDVFGEGFGSFRIAHLATLDKIGFEIFEFPETENNPQAEFTPKKTGIFHISIQNPNIEDLVERIVAAGGKQRMPIREYYPGEKPYKMVYCEDPFGNIIEIYTHSYELTYSSGAYN